MAYILQCISPTYCKCILTSIIVICGMSNGICSEIKIADTAIMQNIDEHFWDQYRDSCLKSQAGRGINYMKYSIKCPILIENTLFNDIVNFANVDFFMAPNIRSTKFGQSVSFSNDNFWAGARYIGIQFGGLTDFTSSNFRRGAEFEDVDFLKAVDFSWSRFDSGVAFKNVNFRQDVQFSGAHFGHFADFSRTKFSGKTDFWNAVLPDQLDFRFVDIENRIDFITAKRATNKDSICMIALFGTDINHIILDMKSFKLWFPADTTYKITREGDSIEIVTGYTWDQRSSVYERVLNNLRINGFTDSYKMLDIEYRAHKYLQQNQYILNILQKWWWNYGYAKERIFIWTLIFWSFFSLCGAPWYPTFSSAIYPIQFIERSTLKSMDKIKKVTSSVLCAFLYPVIWLLTLDFELFSRYTYNAINRLFQSKFASYIIRIYQSYAYIAIIFFGLKIDLHSISSGVILSHPFSIAYLALTYLTGLICMGFIVNILFTI